MIVVDLNLLIYAHNRGVPQHAAAHAWWHATMNGTSRIGLPEPVLFGFLRVTTQRGILARPLAVADALAIVDGWLEWPRVDVLYGTPGSVRRALAIAADLGVAGRLTTDLQIAALAMEYGGALHSADTDFARIAGLRWINPLKAEKVKGGLFQPAESITCLIDSRAVRPCTAGSRPGALNRRRIRRGR
jgi:toxin-antitoxin system PIN domain toxin